jgi:hypothetical protein
MREMVTKELYRAADVAVPAPSWPARNAGVVLWHRPRGPSLRYYNLR